MTTATMSPPRAGVTSPKQNLDRLLESLAEVADLARELTAEPHPARCNCPLCVCGEQMSDEVAITGKAADMFRRMIESY